MISWIINFWRPWITACLAPEDSSDFLLENKQQHNGWNDCAADNLTQCIIVCSNRKAQLVWTCRLTERKTIYLQSMLAIRKLGTSLLESLCATIEKCNIHNWSNRWLEVKIRNKYSFVLSRTKSTRTVLRPTIPKRWQQILNFLDKDLRMAIHAGCSSRRWLPAKCWTGAKKLAVIWTPSHKCNEFYLIFGLFLVRPDCAVFATECSIFHMVLSSNSTAHCARHTLTTRMR